jgi:hypothetical protein
LNVAALGLTAGSHTITAQTYDNAAEDLVRYRDGGNEWNREFWENARQTLTWTVTVP